VARIDPTLHDRRSARDWLDENLRDPFARALVQALFRLTSYANAPERQGAGSNLRQLQHALRGSVLYSDDGWQSLVAAVRAIAQGGGAAIHTGTRVEAIDPAPQGHVVRLADGTRITAANVVIAAEPATARALLGGAPGIDSWLGELDPVHAACLDIGLRALPRPRATFALGIDRPLYFSVHSAAARLAPAGSAAVIHTLMYLSPGAVQDPRAVERELEARPDLMQPGWRAELVARTFLPRMVVTHGMASAARGGERGRPAVAIPGCDGLFAVGDWLGETGQLADASVASARVAAQRIIERKEIATARAAA